MATRAVRRLQPTEIRHFGSNRSSHEMPNLTEIQTRFFESFLQYDVPPSKRKDQGIEGVLREIFPIESYDKTVRLEYVRYDLGKPRYDPDECRQLRLTYGRPLRVWLRLTREQPIEEEVYLGDVPIMMGGGEFIINGAERVVVSQLHRSPGIDFVADTESTDRKTYNCRIIPERGALAGTPGSPEYGVWWRWRRQRPGGGCPALGGLPPAADRDARDLAAAGDGGGAHSRGGLTWTTTPDDNSR